jgi:hypothetical protein
MELSNGSNSQIRVLGFLHYEFDQLQPWHLDLIFRQLDVCNRKIVIFGFYHGSTFSFVFVNVVRVTFPDSEFRPIAATAPQPRIREITRAYPAYVTVTSLMGPLTDYATSMQNLL